MSRRFWYFALSFGILWAHSGCDTPRLPRTHVEIHPQDIYEHVAYLASDELGGRQAGSKYEAMAAAYIEKVFKKYDLKPAGKDGSFLHPFDFVFGVEAGNSNSLRLSLPDGSTLEGSMDRDFRPLTYSDNGTASAELVFAGYGIDAPDLKYSDYAGLDVRNKVVVVLRYTPEGDNPHSPFYAHAALRRKAMVAREKGARAILLVTGPADGEDELIQLRYDGNASRTGILALSVSRSLVDSVLHAAGMSLQQLQEQIRRTKKPASRPLEGISATIQVDVREIHRTGRNVAGLLEGADPGRKHELIIVGAHYDHLGPGGSSSLAPDAYGQIHNGADDNASGTAGLLELVERLAAERDSLRRSVLFVAFSAEELGLLGSRAYVENPGVPLDNAVAMINLDMIGRMQNNRLIVHGVGTSPIWNAMLDSLNRLEGFGFDLKRNREGVGPSDHASFYQKGMPVLFFFTGLHDDYHRPSDDFDKINKEDEARVVRFVHQVIRYLDRLPARPQFTHVSEPEQQQTRRGFRVYLGTIPDYADTDVEGMKLSGVREGGPAARAGLQAGDIIVRFGDRQIKNVYDYTYALQDARPGEEVEIEVVRNGERKIFRLRLEGRK